MKSARSARFAGIVIAGGLALAVPFLVSAQQTPDAQSGPQARSHMMKAHARHGMHSGGQGMHGGEYGMGRGFLRGLDLSEQQRDRIFAIRHASEPALRDQAKVLRGAHAEFGKLALSSEYDEAKVKELADRNAQAISTMAQLRARSMNEMFRVLTPEQQAKVKDRQARWEQSGARGEGRGMRGEARRGAPAMEAVPATPRS